jgi:hypothetical protein
MNKKQISYILFIFILIVSIIFILSLNLGLGNLLQNTNKNEGFTPYIRKIYRPHLRNTRIFVENTVSNYKNKLHNIARKFGVM